MAATVSAAGASSAVPAVATCSGVAATIVVTDSSRDIIGTPRRDVIVGTAKNDWIEGRGGNDLICAGGGDFDVLHGGRGSDRLIGGPGEDSINGGRGKDTIRGGAGPDELSGDGGADRVLGGRGSDRLFGDRGAERLERVRKADDALNGGPGVDTVNLWLHDRDSGHIVLDLEAGVARGQGHDSLLDIENAWVLSNHDDVLRGSSAANELYSADGTDIERGRGGDDVFFGSAGNDFHYGGTGADTISISSDGERYSGAFINLSTDRASSADTGHDFVYGIENASGALNASDVLIGDDRDNVLDGVGLHSLGDGTTYRRDQVYGLDGDDTLISYSAGVVDGGPGSDWLTVGNGARRIVGGPGTDTADYGQATVAVTVDLAVGEGPHDSTTRGSITDIENVTGSSRNDFIVGDSGANSLTGGAGDDQLTGAAGDDQLNGESGSDSGDGGEGQDLCLAEAAFACEG